MKHKKTPHLDEVIRLTAELAILHEKLRIAREALSACAPEDGINIEHRNSRDTCAWCGSSSRWDSAGEKYVDHHSEDCAWVLARKALAALDAHPGDPTSTRDERQIRVADWCAAAFGNAHAASVPQRGIRLAEEAIEAAQSAGCDAAMVHKLVDHIFAKEPGKLNQEIGGVGITLLALAQSAAISADAEESRELDRVLSKPLAHFAARNQAKNDAGFNVSHPGDPVQPASQERK